MNKKGFTLIELLAIIVILAVIAVITVPIILNIIDDAEKSSSIDSAHGYKDALQKYYATKSIQNTELELPNGYYEISELPSDFIVSGELPSKGWVKLKKGIVERFSLKYKDYVVSMDNDKNIFSEKQENVEPHVTNDYQEVEYLESTGTQYIDTGVIGESRWEVTTQFTEVSDTSQILVGCGSNSAQWFGQRNGKYSIGVDTIYNFNVSALEQMDIYLNFTDGKLSATIGNSTINRSGNLTASTFKLFDWFNSNSSYSASARVYKVNVYQGSNLERQFVPAIRKSDNKPGMLDLANLGKNLFDGKIELGSIGNTTGLNSNANSCIRSKNYIEVEPNTTYTISNDKNYSQYIYEYDSDMNFIDYIQNNSASYTFTTQASTAYIKFRTISSKNENDLSVKFQLESGSMATSFEPYGYKFYMNNGSDEFIVGPEI